MEKIKLKCHCRITGPLNFHKNFIIDYKNDHTRIDRPFFTFFNQIDWVYGELALRLGLFKDLGFICDDTESD